MSPFLHDAMRRSAVSQGRRFGDVVFGSTSRTLERGDAHDVRLRRGLTIFRVELNSRSLLGQLAVEGLGPRPAESVN